MLLCQLVREIPTRAPPGYFFVMYCLATSKLRILDRQGKAFQEQLKFYAPKHHRETRQSNIQKLRKDDQLH